jgi:hypothetical protein
MMLFNKTISVAFIVAAIAAIYALLLGLSPLPTAIIDRDHSGFISFGEALDSVDVGERTSPRDHNCVEYYWYKDGTIAFERCSKH